MAPDGDQAAGSTVTQVTLYDVARLAGVSTATVSRVVHGQDKVRGSTRQRVQQAIEQLGYVPNGAAQSLSRRRKDVIGLVCVEHVGLAPRQYDIESMSMLFYDEVQRGAEARIRDHNWSLLITYLREDNEANLPRLLSLSGKVDGLLIGEGLVPSSFLARLARRLPVVVVADVVTADNRAGSAALVSHLVEDHGKRRLFHVDGPATAPDAKERRLGLCDVLHAHPDSQLLGSYNGRFSVQSGEDAGAELLAARGVALPDAVVCANDQMAIGVLREFQRARVAVPADVALTGFDDVYPSRLVDPPLTTVSQPLRDLGVRATRRLLARIENRALPPETDVLPTRVVIRASCGCGSGDTP